MLYAGDTCFYRGEVGAGEYDFTPALRGDQRTIEVDHEACFDNQTRLRLLSLDRAAEVRMSSSTTRPRSNSLPVKLPLRQLYSFWPPS